MTPYDKDFRNIYAYEGQLNDWQRDIWNCLTKGQKKILKGMHFINNWRIETYFDTGLFYGPTEDSIIFWNDIKYNLLAPIIRYSITEKIDIQERQRWQALIDGKSVGKPTSSTQVIEAIFRFIRKGEGEKYAIEDTKKSTLVVEIMACGSDSWTVTQDYCRRIFKPALPFPEKKR